MVNEMETHTMKTALKVLNVLIAVNLVLIAVGFVRFGMAFQAASQAGQ